MTQLNGHSGSSGGIGGGGRGDWGENLGLPPPPSHAPFRPTPPPLPPPSPSSLPTPHGGSSGQRGKASEERRRLLRESESPNPPMISNLFPIKRYYDAADKVLAAFDASLAAGDLDAAYIYGLRFSSFATKALPKHDYYGSPRPEDTRLRSKNRSDLVRTLNALEKVVDAMDVEETERKKREEEERRRWEEAERLRRKEMAARREREEARRRMREAELERRRRMDLEESVAAKLAMLDRMPPRAPSSSTLPDYSSLFESEGGHDGKKALDSDSDVLPIPLDLPPPVLPPSEGSGGPTPGGDASSGGLPPPPSYSELMDKKSEGSKTVEGGSEFGRPVPPPATTDGPPPPSYAAAAGGTKTEYRSGLDVVPTRSLAISTPFVPPPDWEARRLDSASKPPRKEEAAPVPIRTLRRACTDEYESLKRRKAVEVFFLSTYQGRVRQAGRDSTNGCTVISPLVVARHLRTGGSGIADSMIEDVIDSEAPPILRSIRGKLGLQSGALIIPSDVHDYLVDHKILKQSEFVGVCGGNVLDASHLGEFLDLLEDGYDHKHLKDVKDENGNERPLPKQKKKTGAAFFFHEHVMSIVKVVPSSGSAWYDIVDSLPHRHCRECKSSRTRCKDRSSLEATLRWYACVKFSDTDCDYIDKNRWDENMCDFDPRVFQAFIWAAD